MTLQDTLTLISPLFCYGAHNFPREATPYRWNRRTPGSREEGGIKLLRAKSHGPRSKEEGGGIKIEVASRRKSCIIEGK